MLIAALWSRSNYQSAIRAIVSPNRQLLWYNFITTGAFLACMVRFYLGKLLASVRSFALQFQPKTALPRIGYALGAVSLDVCASFFASRQYALMFAKRLFRLAIVAWVSNAFAIRINDKRVQSNINTQRGINGNFHRGWHLNDDCGIPTGRLLGDGQRLNFAVGQRSVVSNLQVSDFGGNHTGVFPTDIANQLLCQGAESH